MMPYAYDSLNLTAGIERWKESSRTPQSDHVRGHGRQLTKSRQRNFKSAPAVWVVKNGKAALLKATQLSATNGEGHKR